ncbi:hypothetical protein [Thermoactinomyces mirandus]|uniref:Uncharacterized protein n=1 Tax=Thermoactinomyces mirandus TaxID=2756294 RepID=A0A7W1XS30_9BACL|nr:hypothetical protein [Thermoactinomyces mirandus]MBA4602277.1 hypothetical protein [Thermoactinomyces mirandus]
MAAQLIAFVMVFVVFAYLHGVFEGIIPKLLAILKVKNTVRYLLPWLTRIFRLFRPVVQILQPPPGYGCRNWMLIHAGKIISRLAMRCTSIFYGRAGTALWMESLTICWIMLTVQQEK